jgi:hypothetical protein
MKPAHLIGLGVATLILQPAAASTEWTLAQSQHENAAVAAQARAFLAKVSAGTVDRSKLTDGLNAALDDRTLDVLESRLHGTSFSWDFVSEVRTPRDDRIFYRLTTGTSVLRFSFGVDADGRVSTFRLAPEVAP